MPDKLTMMPAERLKAAQRVLARHEWDGERDDGVRYCRECKGLMPGQEEHVSPLDREHVGHTGRCDMAYAMGRG